MMEPVNRAPRLYAQVGCTLVLAAALVAGITAVSTPGAPSRKAAASNADGRILLPASLPKAVTPAFTPANPEPLDRAPVFRWSPVERAVPARSAPRSGAPVLAALSTKTPEGTANLVLVLSTRTDARGEVWARARLPVLPNNSTGWIPRNALGPYFLVRTHLVVDRNRFTATLYRAGKRIFRAPIGVGRPESPTPRGNFYIRNKLTRFRSAFYGPIAFGTSARSAVLTDWPAGGFVGIHGTNTPERLPGAVSHGCIRMRNSDIVALARLMPVGTPLTVH
jgi:lipoprotein-anchoring transpeptidase ErfK/SrfK